VSTDWTARAVQHTQCTCMYTYCRRFSSGGGN